MRKKALITILLVMVLGAAASLKAQQAIGFHLNMLPTDKMMSGWIGKADGQYIYGSVTIRLAMQVTGTMYPIPTVHIQFPTMGYDRFTYDASQYGKTVYKDITLPTMSPGYFVFAIVPGSTGGSGKVDARVSIYQVISGSAYVGSPSELKLSYQQ